MEDYYYEQKRLLIIAIIGFLISMVSIGVSKKSEEISQNFITTSVDISEEPVVEEILPTLSGYKYMDSAVFDFIDFQILEDNQLFNLIYQGTFSNGVTFFHVVNNGYTTEVEATNYANDNKKIIVDMFKRSEEHNQSVLMQRSEVNEETGEVVAVEIEINDNSETADKTINNIGIIIATISLVVAIGCSIKAIINFREYNSYDDEEYDYDDDYDDGGYYDDDYDDDDYDDYDEDERY